MKTEQGDTRPKWDDPDLPFFADDGTAVDPKKARRLFRDVMRRYDRLPRERRDFFKEKFR